jgi:putative Holliday junction resolvase
MKYLGVDYGTKRVGIALSDGEGLMAYPHSVLPAGKDLVSTVLSLSQEEGVGRIVVGESNDLSGKPNPLMKDIRAFIRLLEEMSDISVVLYPEVYSSQEAKHIQGENALHDASAAAVVLQSYLDSVRGYDFG